MQGFAVHHDYSNDFNLPSKMPQSHLIVTPWGANIECTLIKSSASDIQATSWTYQVEGDDFSFRTTCYGGLAGDPMKDLVVAFRDATARSYKNVQRYAAIDSWGNEKKFLFVWKNKVVGDSQSTYDPPTWRDEKDRQVFTDELLRLRESDLSLKAKDILYRVTDDLGLQLSQVSPKFSEEKSTLRILITSGGGADVEVDLKTGKVVKVSCRDILYDISLREAIEQIRSVRLSKRR